MPAKRAKALIGTKAAARAGAHRAQASKLNRARSLSPEQAVTVSRGAREVRRNLAKFAL